MGADHTLLVTRESNEADLVKKVHELLGGHPDISIDASGAQATVRLALLVSIVLEQYFLSTLIEQNRKKL